MQTKFKRHQLVKLLRNADPEYIEYHSEDEGHFKEIPILSGMLGRINILLPNSQYHVEILDPEDNSKIIAYALFSEEDLQAVEE